MTRRVSSVTLKRARRGARQRSRIVILASISCGRAAVTIRLEKSAVNRDVPLLCRARRVARTPLFQTLCGPLTDPGLHEELGQGNSRAAHARSRRRFAHAQHVDDPLTQGHIATLTHVGIAES